MTSGKKPFIIMSELCCYPWIICAIRELGLELYSCTMDNNKSNVEPSQLFNNLVYTSMDIYIITNKRISHIGFLY